MAVVPAALQRVLGSHIKYRRKVVGQGEKVDDEMDGAEGADKSARFYDCPHTTHSRRSHYFEFQHRDRDDIHLCLAERHEADAEG